MSDMDGGAARVAGAQAGTLEHQLNPAVAYLFSLGLPSYDSAACNNELGTERT